jgi:hypothetical protein
VGGGGLLLAPDKAKRGLLGIAGPREDQGKDIIQRTLGSVDLCRRLPAALLGRSLGAGTGRSQAEGAGEAHPLGLADQLFVQRSLDGHLEVVLLEVRMGVGEVVPDSGGGSGA